MTRTVTFGGSDTHEGFELVLDLEEDLDSVVAALTELGYTGSALPVLDEAGWTVAWVSARGWRYV